MLYFKNKLARKENNNECYLCNSSLEIRIGYKYSNILKCSNESCKSNIEKGFKFKRNAFFDKDLLKKMGNSEQWKKSPVSLDYWINKGLSLEDAMQSRHDFNSNNGKKASYVNSWDPKHLISKGYSLNESLEIIKKRKEKTTCFRKEFWIDRGYSEKDAIKKVFNIQSENAKKAAAVIDKRIHPTNIKYWTNKGYSEELANDLMKDFCKRNYSVTKDSYINYDAMIDKRKITWNHKTPEEKSKINKTRGRSLSQLIDVFGEEKARKIINDRCSSFKQKNWSKISKEIFVKIEKYLGKPCFYAEHEKLFIFTNKFYYPDFFDGINFIIEFQGDIFHANPEIFTENDNPNPFNNLSSEEIWEKDKQRKKLFEFNGYKVYWIWESDYLKNKEKILKNIINFYEENCRIN